MRGMLFPLHVHRYIHSSGQLQERMLRGGGGNLPHFGIDVTPRALEPLLHDPALASTLRAYFGGPVRYDGAVLIHLTTKAGPENYNPFQW